MADDVQIQVTPTDVERVIVELQSMGLTESARIVALLGGVVSHFCTVTPARTAAADTVADVLNETIEWIRSRFDDLPTHVVADYLDRMRIWGARLDLAVEDMNRIDMEASEVLTVEVVNQDPGTPNPDNATNRNLH